MLREHGEDALAERMPELSHDELARIETLGAYYAFSADAMAAGGSMGGARALALAALDVLDGSGRELQRSRPGTEAGDATADDVLERDRRMDRQLRRHAAAQQVPGDESRRILDRLDPPAWGPPPADASPELRRCHELRTTPLRDLSAEDLRILLEHRVAAGVLFSVALKRLGPDPLLHTGRHPGDLLASVLELDAAFWVRRFDPEVAARTLAESVRHRAGLEPRLRAAVDSFIRDHPPRSVAGISDDAGAPDAGTDAPGP